MSLLAEVVAGAEHRADVLSALGPFAHQLDDPVVDDVHEVAGRVFRFAAAGASAGR